MQRYLNASGDRFCLIGGLALQRWGEPRATRDVDLTLLCPFGAEAAVTDRLLGAFSARDKDPRKLALRRRVLLLWSAGGIGVDVAFGGLPFEKRCVKRATDWELAPGIVLHTCSAEDLLVLKTFAGRPRDWEDVESVVVRQRKNLDWKLVQRELKPLLEAKESLDSLKTLLRLRRKIEKGT